MENHVQKEYKIELQKVCPMKDGRVMGFLCPGVFKLTEKRKLKHFQFLDNFEESRFPLSHVRTMRIKVL